LRTGRGTVACETHHLMCVVCGALPGTTCLDEDLRELEQVHPSRRLTIAERNWRTRNGWEPPELTERRGRTAARSRPEQGPAGPGCSPQAGR
jgi:hypothetical protein